MQNQYIFKYTYNLHTIAKQTSLNKWRPTFIFCDVYLANQLMSRLISVAYLGSEIDGCLQRLTPGPPDPSPRSKALQHMSHSAPKSNVLFCTQLNYLILSHINWIFALYCSGKMLLLMYHINLLIPKSSFLLGNFVANLFATSAKDI